MDQKRGAASHVFCVAEHSKSLIYRFNVFWTTRERFLWESCTQIKMHQNRNSLQSNVACFLIVVMGPRVVFPVTQIRNNSSLVEHGRFERLQRLVIVAVKVATHFEPEAPRHGQDGELCEQGAEEDGEDCF